MSKTQKQELLEYMLCPTITTTRNVMGCSENWYDPYYAINQTFTIDEVRQMSEDEIHRLLRLANNISEGLY